MSKGPFFTNLIRGVEMHKRNGICLYTEVFAMMACLSIACACRAAEPPKSAGTDDARGLETTADASMTKGLDWLKGKQREDGSWSSASYPAITALSLWSFARSDHPDKGKICAKAAEFIVGLVQKDGGIYKPRSGVLKRSGGLSVYNTAVCMTALHSYDQTKYSDTILKARKFMAAGQLTGDSPDAGGFGYECKPGNKSRGRADLSNTGWALMAMRKTQNVEDLRPGESGRVDVNWEAAVEFLEKLQDQDKDDPVNYGGFGYAPSGERSGTKKKKDGTVKLRGFGSMTYAGLESMIYAQVERTDPKVQSTLQWAAQHWSLEENPGMGSKGLFYFYNVMGKALSVSGISELKDLSGKAIPWKKEIIEKLAAIQKDDGSWVNPDNQFWEGDAILVTAYCILTLENARGK